MVAYGIDIIPDVHVRTPFAERVLGNDEVRIIGGWRSQFRGSLVAAPGIKSIARFARQAHRRLVQRRRRDDVVRAAIA